MTLAVGGVALVAVLLAGAQRCPVAVLVMICSVPAGLIGGHDLVNISERPNEVTGRAPATAGWGLWAILAGAIGAFVASLSALGNDRLTAASPLLLLPSPQAG